MPPKTRSRADSTLACTLRKVAWRLASTLRRTDSGLVQNWYSRPATTRLPRVEKTRPRTIHFRKTAPSCADPPGFQRTSSPEWAGILRQEQHAVNGNGDRVERQAGQPPQDWKDRQF